MPRTALVWMRRDLRCDDHSALYHALRRFPRVYCAFVFDTDILDALPTRSDRRVEFIHASVAALDEELRQLAARSGASAAPPLRTGASTTWNGTKLPATSAAEAGCSAK